MPALAEFAVHYAGLYYRSGACFVAIFVTVPLSLFIAAAVLHWRSARVREDAALIFTLSALGGVVIAATLPAALPIGVLCAANHICWRLGRYVAKRANSRRITKMVVKGQKDNAGNTT